MTVISSVHHDMRFIQERPTDGLRRYCIQDHRHRVPSESFSGGHLRRSFLQEERGPSRGDSPEKLLEGTDVDDPECAVV